MNIIPKQDKKEKLIIKGIRQGRKAYTGPRILQIDLTDACANRCVACWTHSPYLNESGKTRPIHNLDVNLLNQWIESFKALDVREIHLAGAGEPLLYPSILNVLKNLKKKEFFVNLNTSLYPIPENTAETLVSSQVDLLTVSLWAGSEKVWHRMHPEMPSSAFSRISSFLMEIQKIKKASNTSLPRIKIYHVITSLNDDSIEEMIDFGITHFADETEFQIADIIPGVTEFLSLKEINVQRILEQFRLLRNRTDFTSEFIGVGNRLDLDSTDASQEQKEYGRFFKPLKKGFRIKKETNQMICPQGTVNTKKAWKEGHPYPVLSYEFSPNICRTCPLSSFCYETPSSLPLYTNFMNVKGVGSFIRRMASSGQNIEPDSSIVNKIPCTVGWYYGRILSDSSFIPCCKASLFPMGSLKEKDFKSIWFSESMNTFREKAKTLSKNDPYFHPINCLKGCDNLGMNLEMIRK
ncbi:MAG: radical SAM protein [Candidatus Aureabacteria bacterium]|nr:radical SAM protein [Candidatus Auribacterota bacterium]